MLNRINFSSIAKVCDTDVYTIEQIYKEIMAQLIHHIKNGSNIRLMFKIGRLATRNGEINWKSLQELGDGGAGGKGAGRYADSFSKFSSTVSNFSKTNSMHKKNLSVCTPSVVKSRVASLNSSNRDAMFHVSNPNP